MCGGWAGASSSRRLPTRPVFSRSVPSLCSALVGPRRRPAAVFGFLGQRHSGRPVHNDEPSLPAGNLRPPTADNTGITTAPSRPARQQISVNNHGYLSWQEHFCGLAQATRGERWFQLAAIRGSLKADFYLLTLPSIKAIER